MTPMTKRDAMSREIVTDTYQPTYEDLRKQLHFARTERDSLAAEIKMLRFERLMLAKACADEPQFYNPLNAAHALIIRDRVLAANKDGKEII